MLHDKAPSFFKRLHVDEAHEVGYRFTFLRITSRNQLFVELEHRFKGCANRMGVQLSASETLFTTRKEKGKEKHGASRHDTITQKKDRPALIVRMSINGMVRYSSQYYNR